MGPAPENARHHAEQPQEQKAQDDQEHHVGAHGGGPVVKVNGEDQLIGGTGEIAHVQIDLIQNKGRQQMCIRDRSLPGLYSVLLYGLYIGSFNCLIFKKEVKTP